jgi:hypothetical protein
MKRGWIHILVIALIAWFVWVHYFRGVPVKRKK